MTAKLLLIKSENGLETRQDYDGLSSANPAFTGTLTGGSAALTGDVDAGGEIKSGTLVGAGARPLVTLADGTIDDQDAAAFRGTIGALAASLKGTANGVAELGADGRVPLAQLPSYVDETVEYPDFASFPTTGEDGKIYVAIDDGTSWRWSGTIYTQISSSLTLGSTASTAHRGDHGTTAYTHSQATGNPHGTTAAQVGAEPYAGIPARTSFWRSTAAGVRAWVQLVAVDITDLATTLAGYLTKANPTFTGLLTGPSATLSGFGVLRDRVGNPAFGALYAAGVTPAAANYVLAMTDAGTETYLGASDKVVLVVGGTSKLTVDADEANLASGVALKMAEATVIDSSRNITGTTLKGGNLTGTGNRPLVTGADGTIDDQDAATFRGTIGAGTSNLALGETSAAAYRGDRGKAAYDHSQLVTGNPHGTTAADVGALASANPNFTGNLLQDGDQRITPSGGGRFTDLSLTTLAAGSNLPVVSDAAGVIRNKTAGEFRTIIGAAASAGVTDGSDAASGVVGQYYEAFLPEASMVYAVNGSPVAVLSLSLPAGDWLVEGRATAHITGAMNGNKVVSGLNTSIAIPTDGTEVYGGLQVFSATNGFQTMTGSKRFSLTATTTVYLVARIDFSAGTPALFGCMSARRMR